SGQITLIGSAAATAPDLARAMLSTWKIEGDGPISFPFAFHSGVFQSYVLSGYTGISGLPFIILISLLLTAQRWRHPLAGLITFIRVASLALAKEVMFALLVLGGLLALILRMIHDRSLKLPADLKRWLAVLIPAGLAALIQGGVFTGIMRARLFPGTESGGT